MSTAFVKVQGFEHLIRAMRKETSRRIIREEVGKQIRRATMTLRVNVNRYIETERHGVPNSPLTVLAKGSDRPLVDRGDLRQGIETDYHAGRRALVGQVGVSRTRSKKDGKKLVNIALALHEGTVIKVTDEVRAAVFAQIRKRTGQRVEATGDGPKRTWRIKGRPFIREPFEEFTNMAKIRIGLGLKKALQRL